MTRRSWHGRSDAKVTKDVERLRRVLGQRRYSPRTEEVYVSWLRRLSERHGGRPPSETTEEEVVAYLSHLANERMLAAQTLNQAASAFAFFYREVLGRAFELPVQRPKVRHRAPTVLSKDEVRQVLSAVTGTARTVCHLLYGSGLRLSEALGIRVGDLSLDLGRLTVRRGKGAKDRVLPLPRRMHRVLRSRIEEVAELHRTDREAGGGWASLPGALHRKSTTAGYELAWQFIFPASRWSRDPATDRLGRHSLHPSAIQRPLRAAVRRSGVLKRVTCHTFRHSFATHLLMDGYDVRTVQTLMGHSDIKTTMVYLHSAEQLGAAVRSPLDTLDEGDIE